jgi:hypothetical protein
MNFLKETPSCSSKRSVTSSIVIFPCRPSESPGTASLTGMKFSNTFNAGRASSKISSDVSTALAWPCWGGCNPSNVDVFSSISSCVRPAE